MFSSRILLYFSLLSASIAVVIKCEYKFDHFPIVGYHYGCYNATVTDKSNPSYVTQIYGRHRKIEFEVATRNANGSIIANATRIEFKNLTDFDVRVFYLSNQTQLDTLPAGIGTFFQNLNGFCWEDGILTKITSNDLIPFPELMTLSFWNNQLQSLDADLFKHTEKLIYINFSQNPIQHVGYGILDKLTVLEAYFQRTNCTDFIARGRNAMFQMKVLLHVKCPPPQTHLGLNTL